MGQEELSSHEFADYVFNTFVKADRKDDKGKWNVYLILKKYAETGFSHKCQEDERKYVEKLVTIIGNSITNWRTHLLLLRGSDRENDFKIQIGKLEQRYRAFGHDINTIIDMINEVIQLNNGND